MQRNANIDSLKLILSIMVIGIHAQIFNEVSFSLNYIFQNGILRIAVPTFFIINGYFLYEFFNKGLSINIWLIRLFKLYLFWMLVYLPFYVPKDIHSIKAIAAFIVTSIVGYHHLWYVVGLMGAGYLLFYLKRKPDAIVFKIVLVLLSMGILLEYAAIYIDFKSALINKIFDTSWLYRNFLFFGFPFLTIGYLINKRKLTDRIKKQNSVALLLISAFVLFLEIFLNDWEKGSYNGFDMYMSLLLFCPFLFMLLARRKKKLKTDTISKASSAIYFIHPLFLILLKKIITPEHGTTLFFLAFSLSALATFPIVKLSHRFKFIL